MVLADDLVTKSELRSGYKEKDILLLQLLQKKGNYYNYNTNYTTQLPLLLPTESE